MTLTKKNQLHFLHKIQKYTHLNISKGDVDFYLYLLLNYGHLTI